MTLITPTVISSASFAENKNKKSAEKAADGNRYSIKLEEYLNAGERRNKKKAEAIANGIKILLNNSLEIKEYINKAINKKVENVTVAYGKVNKRCVSDVKEISNGKIDVTDYFLELVPSDLEHAWQEHHKAKESGDIPLSQKDFENIPNYFENYDEMVYAIQFASGNKKLCVSKKIKDGRMVIVEVVSKSRGSLQFKNAIGMTEEKYQKIFLPKYKRSSSSSRGSDSSNTSLHNDTASNTRIAQKDSSVNTEFMQNSQNNSEAKKFLKVLDTEYLNATESGDVETAQRLVDEVGKAKNDGLYHIYDLTKKIRDTANRINGLERPKPNEGYALENDVSKNSISKDSKKST